MKKRNSDLAGKWINEGLSHKDPDKKLHYIDLALELEPCNITALNNRGMILHKKGQCIEAIECYDRILSQYGMDEYVPALYNKSLALKKMGKNEAAFNFMKKALKKQPENKEIARQFHELKNLAEESDETKEGKKHEIAARDLAVNQIYSRWEPPSIDTILSHLMKCGKREIKYYRGFGEDLIGEKIIQEKLRQKIFSCKSCRFSEKNICHHRQTKAMAVAPDAICRNFRPRENKKE